MNTVTPQKPRVCVVASSLWYSCASASVFCWVFLSIAIGLNGLDRSFADELKLKVSIDSSPESFRGSFSTELNADKTCFYLAYRDPEFRILNKLQERFEVAPTKGTRIASKAGGFEILRSSHQPVWISPTILSFEKSNGKQLDLDFSAKLPRFPTDGGDQWYYYDFYPKKLLKCPDSSTDVVDLIFAIPDEISFAATAPSEWYLSATNAAPTKAGSLRVTTKAPNLYFALIKSDHYTSAKWGDVNLHLFFEDTDFLRLLPTLLATFDKLSEWLPPLGLEHISFVEASQYERDQIPGLILVNKPQHSGLASFQTDWLNWAHWASVMLICRQWFGAMIQNESLNDEWLMRGTAEFLSLTVLKNYEARYDLFNLYEGAYPLLDMNYRQLHDLSAMILFQSDPNAVLVDNDLNTAVSYRSQNAMLPIRHSIALRYLHGSYAGLRQFIHDFATKFRHKLVRPSDFYEEIAHSPNDGKNLGAGLLQWWKSSVWPDFKIESYEWNKNEKSSWDVHVSVSDQNLFGAESDFTIVDQKGVHHTAKLEKLANSNYVGKATITEEPDRIVIDEQRVMFDTDRYNNTTELPDMKFFPGSATGIPDDTYTIVWLPYPFRRPGQKWSLGVRTGLFRYINSSTSLNVETEFDPKHRSAYDLKYSFKWPELRLHGQMSIQQNIFGSRMVELSDTISPLFNWHEIPSLGTAVRWRQVVGRSDSRHGTVSLFGGLKPRGERRYFSYMVKANIEHAPKTADSSFDYSRGIAAAEITVMARQIFDYDLRLFRGEIWKRGDLNPEFYFRPQNIEEARVRSEPPDPIAPTTSMYSVGQDLRLPAILPLVDSGLISTSKLKWRLFYDYAYDRISQKDIRGSGLGLDAPLGGDLTGVGKLSLTQLSFLTIIYSSMNGRESYRPKFLFSFAGEI